MIKKLLVSVLTAAIIASPSAYANNIANVSEIPDEFNACKSSEIEIPFFNGVGNTFHQASRTAGSLHSKFSKLHNNPESINVPLMYNTTKGTALDILEVYIQRSNELGIPLRFELFTQALMESGNANWATKAIGHSLKNIIDVATFPFVTVNKLNPTEQNYLEHTASISNFLNHGKRVIFFAHSQGNLFATEQYRRFQNTPKDYEIDVVHVAPASANLYGKHFLLKQDLVIDKLIKIMGGYVATYTDDEPNATELDLKGHELINVYMNDKLNISKKITNHVSNLIKKETSNEKLFGEGLFEVKLTWDGSGDVDLHVLEPSGNKVYYRNTKSNTGYLDVDNTEGYGPEHYYASCDIRNLETGVYKIGVANFRDATSRTAKVKLGSNQSGSIAGEYNIYLPRETGDMPYKYVAEVNVYKDENNKFRVIKKDL